VFTTAYTGYEESLTDPSYEAQVLTFAYPLIGNYGVRDDRFESDRVHPSAVVARELTDDVADWLRAEGVPAVDGLDTRDLVLDIREGGAMKVGIAAGPEATPADARAELADCPHMDDITDIGERVSVAEPETYGDGDTDVALIDCGAKQSIVDSLVERGATVHRLPHDTTPTEVADLGPDVLFVSNGPGDPANFEAAEALVDEFVGEVPIAGICLGQQVVARSLGGTTEKMDFGHRGVNQPVLDHDSGRVVMTPRTTATPSRTRATSTSRRSTSTTTPPRASIRRNWTCSRASTTPRPTPARTTRWTSSTTCSRWPRRVE